MRKQKTGADKIPTMKEKELKKLKWNLHILYRKAIKHYHKKIEEMVNAEKSLSKVRKLNSRVDYWVGKSKALRCPAFKPAGDGTAYCFVYEPKWSQGYISLFRYRCLGCRVKKKEAKIKGTFNAVFNSK